MLESSSSLLPAASSVPGSTGRGPLKVVCVVFEEGDEELGRLLSTLGVQAVDQVSVTLRKINPATYIGVGKVDEIKTRIEASGAEAAVFDVELSPNQLRNLEKALGKPTIDRPGIIIEIFSQHARTKEAKTQVEVARLQYLLPRLAHFWTHFERQRGGIGQKGMGEKQIEVDRRLVKNRIALLQKRLRSIGDERGVQRAGRKDVLKVALVGYTNAGKSTLLNALTHSRVRAEDKLFSTLDSSVRSLDPNSHPPVVAIDTVGFIERLPTSLIASFRSTLEELQFADLLLHVVDGSSAKARNQIGVTESVLKGLKLDGKPRMVVLNKMDRVSGPGQLNWARLAAPGAVRVSALNPEDARRLRDLVLEYFRKEMKAWEVVIPYSESRLESKIRAYGTIEKMKHMENGTFLRVRISEEWARKLQLARFAL